MISRGSFTSPTPFPRKEKKTRKKRFFFIFIFLHFHFLPPPLLHCSPKSMPRFPFSFHSGFIFILLFFPLFSLPFLFHSLSFSFRFPFAFPSLSLHFPQDRDSLPSFSASSSSFLFFSFPFSSFSLFPPSSKLYYPVVIYPVIFYPVICYPVTAFPFSSSFPLSTFSLRFSLFHTSSFNNNTCFTFATDPKPVMKFERISSNPLGTFVDSGYFLLFPGSFNY